MLTAAYLAVCLPDGETATDSEGVVEQTHDPLKQTLSPAQENRRLGEHTAAHRVHASRRSPGDTQFPYALRSRARRY